MNLGLEGRTALLSASSRGLGFACAQSLAREGVNVVLNGRNENDLVSARQKLLDDGATGTVQTVVADINSAEGRAKLLAASPTPDILVNNNEGPPPGSFAGWGEAEWQAALVANFLAPTFLIQGVIEGMRARRFGRIVNITSAMVKTPHSAMGLSTAARSALTALCKGVSKDAAADNVTLNNLLPERFDTARQEHMAQLVTQLKGISYEDARAEQVASIPAGRLGDPKEFGDACAFLCSAQSGFISGQNLQLDGGAYAGLI
ncbi:MAG: SDR family oxidoreductase [Pseudomonadota bacterium]